ncbi:MAG: S8 family serine peptidase, partial [Chloroflexota bacterium]|nr:S8 family serine peptidase [Chloroflexota bacterium]
RWAGFCLVAVIVTATQATPAGARTQNDAKISPQLLALARSQPKDDFAVIVRAAAKPSNGHKAERAAAAAKRADGKVGRGLSIIGGASAMLRGAKILALANDPDVDYISADEVVTATFDPVDGAALASSPGILEVGAPDVWRQLGVTGRGIGVAILDSGIAPHPDLAGRIVASVDFTHGGTGATLVPPADPGGHGTHVAGLVAGDGAASAGAYAGVAPGANLIDVRVIAASGSTNVSTLIAGMQWVLAHRSDYNIRVVNLSAGGPATRTYRDDPLATAAEVLVFAGITVVVSAGNEGPKGRTITSPGTDPYVITVGGIDDNGTATTADDALASWSSRGVTPIDGLAKPDLVAPGRKVVSLRSPGSTLDHELPDRLVAGLDPLVPAYFRLSGTSMAAPVVAGVVALVLEHSPALTPAQVKDRLKGTATALPYGSPETTGSGLVDAPAAVAASDQTDAAAADPVSAGFASEMYPLLYGQPLVWRDLAFNGGVDSNGVSWSEVSWSNVVWDAITWQNVEWESFNWSAVNWQDISWEDISWEGITWEDISWELVPVKDKGRKGHGGGKVLD